MTVGWLEFNVRFQHKCGYIRDEEGYEGLVCPDMTHKFGTTGGRQEERRQPADLGFTWQMATKPASVCSDGVKTFFSETETFAKTQVSRHETSQDI